MKNKISNLIFIILIILAAGWGIRWYMRKTIVPEMKFQSSELILTGANTKTTINNLKGNIVIVSFFQTWCGPCIQEMGVFEELQSAVNSSGFKILCISDEETDRIKMLQQRFDQSKIVFAYSAESLASMGIHVYPTTYLLNKKGEVIKSKLEGYDWRQEKATIEKLIAE
ncbi:MAG: TlpA family protein disulfide reductase [Ferruginibacter sp.]|nr:TlpA family protein disulfide reductase [Ferruginibacter sp.]